MRSMLDPLIRNGALALAFACFAGACSETSLLEDVRERNELVVAIDSYYPPQSLLAEDGTWSGYDVEVAREIAARLGVGLRIDAAPWDEVLAGHWRGRWDIAVDSMTKTVERDRVLHFIEPAYRVDEAYFFTRVASGVDYAAISSGTPLCTAADTTYYDWFGGTLMLAAGEIYVAPPPSSALSLTAQTCAEGVIDGTYDLFVDSYGGALPWLESGDVVATGPTLFVEHIFVTMDRSSPVNGDSLRERVAEILAEMHADGFLAQLSIEVYGIDLSTGAP
jgi:polar amino acid transport system substrate-binding protein